MTPIVDGIEEQYQGRIAVQRIDANRDDGPKIVRDYNILGHPTLLLIDRQGQEQSRLIGPQEAEDVTVLVEQILVSIAQ